MKLISDYVEKLRKLDNPKFHNWTIKDKLIHHISDSSRGTLHENVTQINFNSLYANLQVGLFEVGLIDEKWKDDIDRVKWFLKNRKELKSLPSGEYEKWKIHCNSLYMKIKSPYVTEYMHLFYSDLIDKYDDRVIHIDVDDVILNIKKTEFQAKESVPELNDFSYDVRFINYFYAEELKKYIKQDEFGEIESSGFLDYKKKSDLEALIKIEIRRRRLERLGI